MKLDQHFLIDESVCVQVIELAEIAYDDIVLEIGAGKGSLTRMLKPTTNALICELDSKLAYKLKQEYKFTVLHENGLLVMDKHKFNILISSVPYSIAEPMLTKLFTLSFRRAVLVLPEGFAGRLVNATSRLGILASAFLDIRISGEVPPEAFSPPPKVKSAVVVIIPRTDSSIMRELYLQSDKKLKNALREALVKLKGITKRDAESIIAKMELPEELLDNTLPRISSARFVSLRDKLRMVNS